VHIFCSHPLKLCVLHAPHWALYPLEWSFSPSVPLSKIFYLKNMIFVSLLLKFQCLPSVIYFPAAPSLFTGDAGYQWVLLAYHLQIQLLWYSVFILIYRQWQKEGNKNKCTHKILCTSVERSLMERILSKCMPFPNNDYSSKKTCGDLLS
jgi:hypothetical protein